MVRRKRPRPLWERELELTGRLIRTLKALQESRDYRRDRSALRALRYALNECDLNYRNLAQGHDDNLIEKPDPDPPSSVD